MPAGDYSTQGACEGAGLHWELIPCSVTADHASNDCAPIQGLAEAAGFDCCNGGGGYVGPSAPPTAPPPAAPPPPVAPPSPTTPPPPPTAPPPASPPTEFKVVTEFTLAGTVNDYGASERLAIQKVLAAEAGVTTDAVSLTITSGSVVVAAEIYVADAATATTTSSTLSTGILASASALDTALTAQFTADGLSTAIVSVEALVAPTVDVPSNDDERNVGVLLLRVALAVGGVAAVVVSVRCYLKKKKAGGSEAESGASTKV